MKMLDVLKTPEGGDVNAFSSMSETVEHMAAVEEMLQTSDPLVELKWFPVYDEVGMIVPVIVSVGQYQTGVVALRNKGYAAIY